MEKFKKAYTTVLYVIFTVLVIATAVFLVYDLAVNQRHIEMTDNWSEFSEWEWVHADGTREPFTMPGTLNVGTEEEFIVEATLPDNLTDDMWLSFRNRANVNVIIDGGIRYSYDRKNVDIPGGIVKEKYEFIHLYSSDSGKKIAIHRLGGDMSYMGGHDQYNGVFTSCYIGDSAGLIVMYLRKGQAFYMSVVVLILVAAFSSLFGFVLWIMKKQTVPLMSLGLGVLFMAAWMLFDSALFQFFFDNYYIDGTMRYIMVTLMLFPILDFINRLQRKRYSSVYTVLYTISILVAAVFAVLHFGGIFSYAYAITYINIIQAVLIVITIVMFIFDIATKHASEYQIMLYGVIGLAAFGLIEVIMDLLDRQRTMGTIVVLGLYFMLIMAVSQQLFDFSKVAEARKRAEEANVSKSYFLANMSHEIRTPINSILGMNEMIIRESSEQNILEYANQLKRSGQLLLGLVNDVLDFSKIEAGKMEIISVKYKTLDVMNDLASIMRERASAKGLGTEIKISEDMPSELNGDEVHIKQIAINLISNAVKYTQSGKVMFYAGSEPDTSDGRCILKLTVRDTGMGIKPENLDKLFETFVRVDEKKNRSIEGTGLGLSIVKKLVDVMNGHIRVESEYGKGSSFIVTIPQEISDAKPIGEAVSAAETNVDVTADETKPVKAPNAKVLIVDDNMFNLKVAEKLLKRTLVQTTTASDGNKCIELCRENKYDIIFMDHMMPDPDGIKTLHLMREDEKCINNETPVIALTANAISGVREMYMSEGFTDYLAKPIEPDLFEKCLRDYLPSELLEN